MRPRDLTKRENQIMEILWNAGIPLSANEIKKRSEDDISIYTVQQVLQRLMKREYIKVSGYGFTKNAITRTYAPVLTQAEYIRSFVGKKTCMDFIKNYIQEESDMDTIQELEDTLKSKREQLLDRSC